MVPFVLFKRCFCSKNVFARRREKRCNNWPWPFNVCFTATIPIFKYYRPKIKASQMTLQTWKKMVPKKQQAECVYMDELCENLEEKEQDFLKRKTNWELLQANTHTFIFSGRKVFTHISISAKVSHLNKNNVSWFSLDYDPVCNDCKQENRGIKSNNVEYTNTTSMSIIKRAMMDTALQLYPHSI